MEGDANAGTEVSLGEDTPIFVDDYEPTLAWSLFTAALLSQPAVLAIL
jgi:hypothetical protein